MKKIIREGHRASVYIEKNFAYKVYDNFYPEEWIDKEIFIHNLLREKTSLNIVDMIKSAPNEIKMPYLSQNTLDINLVDKFDDVKLIDFVHLQSKINTYNSLELENAHLL